MSAVREGFSHGGDALFKPQTIREPPAGVTASHLIKDSRRGVRVALTDTLTMPNAKFRAISGNP